MFFERIVFENRLHDCHKHAKKHADACARHKTLATKICARARTILAIIFNPLPFCSRIVFTRRCQPFARTRTRDCDSKQQMERTSGENAVVAMRKQAAAAVNRRARADASAKRQNECELIFVHATHQRWSAGRSRRSRSGWVFCRASSTLNDGLAHARPTDRPPARPPARPPLWIVDLRPRAVSPYGSGGRRGGRLNVGQMSR